MRRLLLAVPLVLAACKTAPVKPPEPDVKKIQARAEAAHEEATLTPAPEAPPPSAKVLEKDKAGCTWLESEGLVTVGEQDSRTQARAAAVSHARVNAMRELLGVEVRSRFMDFQQEGLRDQQRVTENILQTTRSGRILDEKVVEEGYRDLPGCVGCRYAVRLRACVVPAESGSDKDFHVELALSRTRFVAGDKATLSVMSTRDAWLYLYDVGMDGQTWLVKEGVPVKAGQEWTYPDDPSESMVAEMPDARSEVSAETLRVVAAKAPLPKRVWDPADGGWLGVLRRLHAGKVEWIDDAQAFTIYRR